MRAWTLAMPLAVLGGAIVIHAVGWLPALQQLIALGIAATILLGLGLIIRHRGRSGLARWLQAGCLLGTAVAVGLLWSGGHAQLRMGEQFPAALEQVPLTVSGYSCSVPVLGSWSSVRQDFCVTAWHDAPQQQQALPLPARLRLVRYNADGRFDLAGPATLEVSLKRPHGSVNPDGFRYETWLYRQGYLATGSLRAIVATAANPSQLYPTPPCGLSCRYHRGRQAWVEALNVKAAEMTHLALVESLALGSRGQLQPADWALLQATGTGHLLAISGLHVGLVAAMVGWVCRWLLLRLVGDRLGPRLVPLATFGLVCLAGAGYALLAGFTVPTQRALVMVVVAGALLLRGRLRRAWDAWLLALLLVLLLDPFAVLDLGFWLSFGAVGCLVLAFGGRLAAPRAWASLLIAQLAISLGLWPILSVLGIAPAPLGLVANLFAIPWLSLLVMPLLLVALPLIFLGGWPGAMAAGLLDGALGILWAGLTLIADLGQGLTESLGSVPALSLGVPLLLALLGFLVLLPVGRTYRFLALALGAVLALRLMTTAPLNSTVAEPQVLVMDVGQGLAVLVRDGDQAMLYDTGPAGGGFSAVASQLLPSFSALGTGKLDLLVLSHADNDHAGAWEQLAGQLNPDQIVSGEPAALAASVRPCQAAHGRRIGRWRLEAWQAPAANSGNGHSCVIEAHYDGYRVALTGDIGLAEEQAWLAARTAGPVDLLLAPHHGSKSSSGAALVTALAPRYTVFSAGYRNRYGHPHQQVSERYREQGGEVLATAGSGALTFTFADRLHYRAQRDRAPFWIRAAEAVPEP